MSGIGCVVECVCKAALVVGACAAGEGGSCQFANRVREGPGPLCPLTGKQGPLWVVVLHTPWVVQSRPGRAPGLRPQLCVGMCVCPLAESRRHSRSALPQCRGACSQAQVGASVPGASQLIRVDCEPRDTAVLQG